VRIEPNRPFAGPVPVRKAAAPAPSADGPADVVSLGARPRYEGTGSATALRATPGFFARLVGWAQEVVSGEGAVKKEAAALVDGVLALDLRGLTDAALTARTAELRTRAAAGEDICVEAFAVAREAARRVTGMTATREQILGGVYAHQGAIVDMKTGEGKTLMSVMPAYLRAVTGQPVHVITANDYLARRDCELLGPVFSRLGVSAGLVGEGQFDITYGTASRFGFQYLTDHLVADPSQRQGRDLSTVFALVDEADKVLLDEASTPLVIADHAPEDPRPVQTMAEVVRHLKPEIDFASEPARRTAWLTERGLERVEQILGLELYNGQNEALLGYLQSAVEARALFRKDVDYVVRDGQVVLVDGFTGRLKPGHRFNEGLHQAIEAKEKVAIGDAQKTMASITYPNFFRLYGQVSGMTGTGLSGKDEFAQVFGLPVRAVPTSRPCIRRELPDELFDNSAQRDRAVVSRVAELHRSGRPVLVGTRTIEHSEKLSAALAELGIRHSVLNARNPEAEAGIIAQAGRRGAVTIATNMAGRGTDIKLGGDPPVEKAAVVALGGLAVLGAERNEARRIDEQLAGRAGRQGDPGSSQFFVSRDDEVLRLFPDEASVDEAQARVEARNLEGRLESLKFDGVVNLQRQAVYARRNAVLEGADLAEEVKAMPALIAAQCAERNFSGTLDAARLQREVEFLLARSPVEGIPLERKSLARWLEGELSSALGAQMESMAEMFNPIARDIWLQVSDQEWADQQEVLTRLREGHWVETMHQENPELHYQKEAHRTFTEMEGRVAARVVRTLLAARPDAT